MTKFPLPDRAPVPADKWEEVDPYGDAHRLKLGVRLTAGLSLATVACLALIAIGDRQLRLALAGVLVILVVCMIGVVVGWVRILKRLARGRGLVAGDPFRPEGIDPNRVSDPKDSEAN